MYLRNVLMSVLVLVGTECFGGDDQWLGYFKGSVIHGYQIEEVEMLVSSYSGPQHERVYLEVLEYMKGLCLKKGGRALINTSLIPSVGEVKAKVGNSEQTAVVKPGIHVGGMAECVLKVEKVGR